MQEIHEIDCIEKDCRADCLKRSFGQEMLSDKYKMTFESNTLVDVPVPVSSMSPVAVQERVTRLLE